MPNTTYRTLYDSVLSKIREHMLVDAGEDMTYQIIGEYLLPAILMFQDCSQDLSDRNDESQEFNYKLTETNFEILSNYIVIAYIDSNYIRTGEMLKAHLSSADFHKYDNKDVLSKVMAVRQMYKDENDYLMLSHSYDSDSFYDGSIFDLVMERKR